MLLSDYLDRVGTSGNDALASLEHLFASSGFLTGLKKSLRSSTEKPPSDQTPSTSLPQKPSAPLTPTRKRSGLESIETESGMESAISERNLTKNPQAAQEQPSLEDKPPKGVTLERDIGYILTEDNYAEKTEKISEAKLSERAGILAFRAGVIFNANNPGVSNIPSAQNLPERFQDHYSEIRSGFEEAERGGVQAERVQHELDVETELLRRETEIPPGGEQAQDGAGIEAAERVREVPVEPAEPGRGRGEPAGEAVPETGRVEVAGVDAGRGDRIAEVHPPAGERRGGISRAERDEDREKVERALRVAGRDEGAAEPSLTSPNYHITPDDRIRLGGKKQRYRDNIKAIKWIRFVILQLTR